MPSFQGLSNDLLYEMPRTLPLFICPETQFDHGKMDLGVITNQSPVVQSIDSLMSLLLVIMLTVLESTVSNSQVCLLTKRVKATDSFFSRILAYTPHLIFKVLTTC